MNIHVIDWHSKGLASVPNPIRGGLSLLKGELPPDRLLLLVLLLRFIGQRGSAPYWSKLVQRTGEIFTTSGDVRRIWSCGNRVPICTVYIIYCVYIYIYVCIPISIFAALVAHAPSTLTCLSHKCQRLQSKQSLRRWIDDPLGGNTANIGACLSRVLVGVRVGRCHRWHGGLVPNHLTEEDLLVEGL